MPFVKLDCGILNSTLWFERTQREIFLTALLMAEPCETTEPMPQMEIGSLTFTGWSVPPGWYGFVPAASVGILHRAGITDDEAGLAAMSNLGEPEAASRSKDFDGRRLVRVDGGFIILNYMKYRERDYTTAERSRRYRERLSNQSSRRDNTPSHRDITQAEGDVEAEGEKKKNSRAKEPPDPRVKEFLLWFEQEFPKRRAGAAYLVKWAKHGALVKAMLKAVPLEHLKVMAQIMLSERCEDEFIINSGRGIEVLSGKFDWLSDRRAAWEARQRPA